MINFKKSQLVKVNHHGQFHTLNIMGAIPYVEYVDADTWLSGIIIDILEEGLWYGDRARATKQARDGGAGIDASVDILEEGLWYGAGIDVYVISLQKIFRYYPEYVRLLKKDV